MTFSPFFPFVNAHFPFAIKPQCKKCNIFFSDSVQFHFKFSAGKKRSYLIRKWHVGKTLDAFSLILEHRYENEKGTREGQHFSTKFIGKTSTEGDAERQQLQRVCAVLTCHVISSSNAPCRSLFFFSLASMKEFLSALTLVPTHIRY